MLKGASFCMEVNAVKKEVMKVAVKMVSAAVIVMIQAVEKWVAKK